MEIKIKDGNGYVDAEWTMEDGVMVVSPKEVKFKPKDGDVVVYFNHDKPTIYVYKGGCKYNTSFYVAYSGIRNEVFALIGGHLDRDRNDIRLATEEEKKLLFDKLAEKGWEWKADTKELVKIKWKPYEGGDFWLPYYNSMMFAPTKRIFNIGRDKSFLDKGWVFKTEQECQELCDRLNLAINSVKP